MHMADALISPSVGGAFWAASASTIAYCGKKLKEAHDDRLVPLMGVLGAFIFTAQMVNFSVPGTGSSGHLGGGLILAILLGPYAAFLVIASVLTVQCLFFADGGLLALGCNLINMGFIPAFIAYPLIYRPIAGGGGQSRQWIGALLAAVIGLQMGALGVVFETKASGVSALPFQTFLLLMQPIHLAIGIIEGLATAVIVGFVSSVRPEVVGQSGYRSSVKSVCLGILAAAILVGGILSCFASKRPDGLEWAIAKITGHTELQGNQDQAHRSASRVQERTALLPDYQFRPSNGGLQAKPDSAVDLSRSGTSISGILGGTITLAICVLIAFGLKLRRSGCE